MAKPINKVTMLAMIRESKLTDEAKRAFLVQLLAQGEITEDDLAQALQADLNAKLDTYAKLLASDDTLAFLVERFRDYPEMLARALVKARPDIFYAYGFAVRLVLKLRPTLGVVLVKPRRGPGGGSVDPTPSPKLSREVLQDILTLDIECCFRQSLFWFSRDVATGHEFISEKRGQAQSEYERAVWDGVKTMVDRLLALPWPGIKTSLNGRSFPALHVRWWLDQAVNVPRCLNIGDTGSYKTSFAAIAMRHYGCRRVLVMAAPHARQNWQRELAAYFDEQPRVQVIYHAKQLEKLDPGAEFTVIGYSTLAKDGVADKLLTGGFNGLVIDECHYARNVVGDNPAKRAAACFSLIKGLELKRCIALSATPWENRPEEMAMLAAALRPDLFVSPETFLASGAQRSPRLMRELFASQILDVELREVADLPDIRPKPWEDLHPTQVVRPNARHWDFYRAVLDDRQAPVEPHVKMLRLLQAVVHPPLLAQDLPSSIAPQADDWQLSSKLAWLREFIARRLTDHKIVVASGLFAEGITHPRQPTDADTTWVGGLLRQWYGQDTVITIDDTVSLVGSEHEDAPREAAIRRWRTDPKARILLISAQACPDSINLSVGEMPGVKALAITSLSLGWKPMKQFLGRFYRHGQGVPIEIVHPVLAGTIDEDLLRLNVAKWEAQCLFRAGAPLTNAEWDALQQNSATILRNFMRSAAEHVALLFGRMTGGGEGACKKTNEEAYGVLSVGEALARHFLASQEYTFSGHVSRLQKTVIDRWRELGLVTLNRVLDAGCGTLTLERRLDHPVYGIDLNQHMIDVGRSASAHQGVNALVGVISDMPADWTDRFELTVSSLVLDLTSLRELSHGSRERLRVLSELVRVTHPHGLVWLTWGPSSHDDNTLKSWMAGLRQAGYVARDELTGKVHSLDHNEQPCEFWSLLFSPNGHSGSPILKARPDTFALLFEQTRIKDQRPKTSAGPAKMPTNGTQVRHERFSVATAQGALQDAEAAKQAALSELNRGAFGGVAGRVLHRSPEDIAKLLPNDWRALQELVDRGLIRF